MSPARAWFYTETAVVPESAHVIQKNMSVLPLLGVNDPTVRFPFRVSPSAVVRTVVERARAAGGSGFMLLNPGAAWPNKRWAPSRFAELARRVRERFALPSFVLWGRGESPLAESIVLESQGAALLAPETSLRDLLALSKEATLMVSGDTGPLHLAASMGTPLVGLYGPTWPERNGPWDPADEVVSRARSCVCHHKRQCQTAVMCLDDVGVDEVFRAVERRLAKAGRA